VLNKPSHQNGAYKRRRFVLARLNSGSNRIFLLRPGLLTPDRRKCKYIFWGVNIAACELNAWLVVARERRTLVNTPRLLLRGFDDAGIGLVSKISFKLASAGLLRKGFSKNK